MSNVINLFDKRTKKKEESCPLAKKNDTELFIEAMERNQKNKERMAEDRIKANKNVTRSYRLKE